MQSILQQSLDISSCVSLPSVADLEVRLERTFWDNDELREDLLRQFSQLPQSVESADLLAVLETTKLHDEDFLTLLGCCMTDASEAVAMFWSATGTDDIIFNFPLEGVEPDSAEYRMIAEASPRRPDTIQILVDGLGGRTGAVGMGADALVSYGPQTLPFLLDAFDDCGSWAQIERAKILDKLSAFADESCSAALLKLCRSVSADNAEFVLLRSKLMSAVLRAWRARLNIEDMNQAFAFLQQCGVDPSNTEFYLALRFANTASPDAEIYITQLLKVLDHNGPSSLEGLLFDEIMLRFGESWLKNMKDPALLQTTFTSLDGKMALAIDFKGGNFAYAVQPHKIVRVKPMPPSWLPHYESLVARGWPK